jgi:hypothetical protein
MRRHRTITLIAGLAVGVVCAVPANALGGPLLSGYGGPGQGSQSILGAALLNGGSGGGAGGSSSGESGPSATAAGGGEAAAAATVKDAASAQRSDGRPATAGRHRHPGASVSRDAQAGGRADLSQPTTAAAAYAAAERGAPAAGSGALGLSPVDFLLIVLGFGMLALIAIAMRRLTRTGG